MQITRQQLEAAWNSLPNYHLHRSDTFVCPVPDIDRKRYPDGIFLTFVKDKKIGQWVLSYEIRTTIAGWMP